MKLQFRSSHLARCYQI